MKPVLSLASVISFLLPLPVVVAQEESPIPTLLITGANNHDWSWTAPALKRVLEESGRFDVTITDKPAETLGDAADLSRYRVFVLDYNGKRWGEAAERNFLAAVRSGIGVSVIHAADNAFPGWVEYEKLVGLLWRKGTGHGRFHPFAVAVTDPHHPITAGMPDMRNHPDELYHRLLHMHDAEVRVLAAAHSSRESGGTGRYEPMVIVSEYGDGRVFHTPLGHVWKNVPQSRASFSDPQFRRLVQRGTEWAATGSVTIDPMPSNWLTDEEYEQGFRLLFNGRDLKGWRGYKMTGPPKQGWVVKETCLVHTAGGGGGDLITEEQFGEFELRFDWKVATNANSGVIYRVQETKDTTWQTGPEYQVLDDATAKPGPKHAAGALYDLVPATSAEVRPAGAWNQGRIVLRGGRVQHWLNGTKVVDAPITGPDWQALVQGSKFKTMPEFGVHDRGYIALQDHGDEVWYRNLRICN